MDPNIFAKLYPQDRSRLCQRAFQLNENKGYYRPGFDIVGGSHSPAFKDNQDDFHDQIILLLDNPGQQLKNPALGWQFGTDPATSDILLGHHGTQGISRRHFAISVTPDFRVQIHQQTSQPTTIVYDKQRIALRNGDSIYLSLEPGRDEHWTTVYVALGKLEGLQFAIVFPNQKLAPPAYRYILHRFIQKNPPRAPDGSGTNSLLGEERLRFRKEIGRGSFGAVYLVVSLQTGRAMAEKRLLNQSDLVNGNATARGDLAHAMKQMQKEIHLMQKLSHSCIMSLVDYTETPVPTIVMPFYPYGNVSGFRGLRFADYLAAFHQILCALDYLHGQGVAHRDLKPENLLIDSLRPFHVRVADFGLSRAVTPGSLMTTFCGNQLYSAPEIYPGYRQQRRVRPPSTSGGGGASSSSAGEYLGYSVAVDIWSAGVMMLGWAFGLPSYAGIPKDDFAQWNQYWPQAVVNAVQQRARAQKNDPLPGLLQYMVVLDPTARYSARQCLEHGYRDGIFRRD
ncbi:Protein kinase-like domain protein [Niveomyces insectorum RCEF 264]|uniref:Protein kinase-like domain protein n=1 Tax=Niveomyces insectorum RCEF 264 TaxID=1081102 RepID=A0A162I891_9HYPO|nr:Protein kinase-like domain protein [Niveomyces insectorum RCEF 264]